MYFFSLILEAHSPDLQRNHFCQDDSHKKGKQKGKKPSLASLWDILEEQK